MTMLTLLAPTLLKILFFLGFVAQPQALVNEPLPQDPPPLPPNGLVIVPDEPAPPDGAGQDDAAETVEAFLGRLERAADDLRDFKADLRKITVDKLDRATERTGSLVYQIKPGAVEDQAAHKRFAVLFDRVRKNGRFRVINERWVFDGRWLVEMDQKRMIFIKREVVPPGKTFDPLKLGEGPFPLPIGQKRADVLARFDVAFVDLPTEGAISELQNVRGVRLTPKLGTREAREFKHVDVFYDTTALIPTGVIAIDANGGESRTILLENLKRNQGVDEALLSIEEPEGDGWRIEIKPFAR